MALSRKKGTTIALDPAHNRLLTRAARERGVSRIRIHSPTALIVCRTVPAPPAGEHRRDQATITASVAASASCLAGVGGKCTRRIPIDPED